MVLNPETLKTLAEYFNYDVTEALKLGRIVQKNIELYGYAHGTSGVVRIGEPNGTHKRRNEKQERRALHHPLVSAPPESPPTPVILALSAKFPQNTFTLRSFVVLNAKTGYVIQDHFGVTER
jgi:hypothetical protein